MSPHRTRGPDRRLDGVQRQLDVLGGDAVVGHEAYPVAHPIGQHAPLSERGAQLVGGRVQQVYVDDVGLDARRVDGKPRYRGQALGQALGG